MGERDFDVVATDAMGVARLSARGVPVFQAPLYGFVPGLHRLLDMPERALPGDSDVPRVQGPGFGASQRMVITPGDEASSLFHMPGGQSGHPLSAHYRDGHRAWVEVAETPLLPGEAVARLTLRP